MTVEAAGRRAQRVRVALDVLLLVACVAGAVASSRSEDWRDLQLLGVLTITAMATALLMVNTGELKFSGAFLTFGLAVVLMGPAPATALGLAYALFLNWRLYRWRCSYSTVSRRKACPHSSEGLSSCSWSIGDSSYQVRCRSSSA